MQTPLISSAISRRSFVKSAGAATMLAASPFARAGRVAASDRITLGVIGWGMQGPNNTKGFMAQPDCQVVAMCEIDPKKMDAATGTINQHYGNTDCKQYRDYREMIARDDIDAIMIAIPDT